MMGEILNLTENTFHINKSIHDVRSKILLFL